MHECSTCGQELEFIEADPSVGIMSSAWYCAKCEEPADADDTELEPEYPE